MPALILSIWPAQQVELFSPGREIQLGGISVRNTGHDLFHQASSSGIACASCHPEGAGDGRVWQFSGQGARRTQSLHNGIADTQPFHWDGELNGMDKLIDEVFVRGMGGVFQSPERLKALEHWLLGLKAAPALRVATDLGVNTASNSLGHPKWAAPNAMREPSSRTIRTMSFVPMSPPYKLPP